MQFVQGRKMLWGIETEDEDKLAVIRVHACIGHVEYIDKHEWGKRAMGVG